jgi:hypothetical protein
VSGGDRPGARTINVHNLASASGNFDPNETVKVFRAFRLKWSSDFYIKILREEHYKAKKIAEKRFSILARKP